ncbi:MAG TPA: beta-ketoacyl synthase, partial [Acidobacteria bacterium]|nr:beta-ketoacyl synthase [Acidobacteriota bacterium]
MGCLFPRAQGLQEYWRLIRTSEDSVTDVPPTHWSLDDYFDPTPGRADLTYCRRGAFLSPTTFDPTEFGIPPTVLEATDTAQLLGLIVAKAALEDAGYGPESDFDRTRASVILGVTGTLELVIPLGARLGHPKWRRAMRDAGVPEHLVETVIDRIADDYVGWQENSFPGLLGNVVAGRIANRLDLRGTNCVVDAACASSLGAIHLAMLELATGRTDMVISGGVDTLNDVFMFMCFSKTQALSATGDARPFAKDADGTVIGEGLGMVVLKRLADAERDGDRIYSVIRGIGTSSDGRSQSIYAPRASGQTRALRDAYAVSGVDPSTVQLVEAHGTGTTVGDAVEFDALRSVYAAAQSDGPWCALGSVKSQIGHTKAAAGAAGLIKAALALHHKVLPATIKISEPNPRLEIDDSPFYLNTETRPWLGAHGHPRRSSVSAFGFGGSN